MDEGNEQLKERGARDEYSAKLKERAEPRSDFDAALLAYLELEARTGATGQRDGRRAKMLAALDQRATWSQVRLWRRGARRRPQWAIDLLNEKIDRRIAELQKRRAA